MRAISHDYFVDRRRLEALYIPATQPNLPTVVMLHEGLGSVAHWKDFPSRVAKTTGAAVFVYSRYGHGNSDPLAEPRTVSYMHHEAEIVLPEILRLAGIERPLLLGQSDGASIAIIFAGTFPGCPIGLILEAPHVFVEDVTVKSIARSTVEYQTTELPEKLGRYHASVESMFRGWNNVWLDPRFRSWNIESYLKYIRCPVLVIQGAEDEYGTVKQLDAILAKIPSAEAVILENCKHAPHRDQPEAALSRISRFIYAIQKRNSTESSGPPGLPKSWA